MGEKCNKERNRNRKRIGKRKNKAIRQLEGLVSARSPLGILKQWFTKLCRPFRKHIRSTGRVPARRVSCRRPILQDPLVLTMDCPLSRSQGYPEECMYPPGSENNNYNAMPLRSEPSRMLFSNRLETFRNPGGLSLQRCPTSAVSSQHPTDRKDFVIDIGCSSSPQSPQFQTCLESSSNSVSHESRARDNHKRKMEETISNPNLAPDVKSRIVQGLWDQFEASQSQELHIETFKWKRECKSLSDSKADIQKYLRALKQKHVEDFANKCRQLDAARDELSSHLKNCRFESGYIASLEEDNREKHDAILSLNEEVQSLNSTVAELQKTASLENESRGRLKSANPEGYAEQNAISGSYVDEAATPLLLNTALSSAKGALKNFQKALTDAIKSRGDIASIVNLLQPDIYFARDNHVSYAARAVVYGVLFEGFENESFNTGSGVSRFLDPDVRQVEFFKYFIREQEQNGDIEDPHFEAFCEMKVPRLWEGFNLRQESNKQSMLACIEELGGSKMLSSFREAARKVWLLHKLAFSFEPPASIFRVEQGATVDTNYMEPVVSLEDSSRFVNEVGFMISPGLRLRKTILRSEVYLSSAKSATA